MTAAILVPRTGSPQPGGPPVDKYTNGFAYQAINGVTFVGHNGGTTGYEGQLDIYPKSGLSRYHPHKPRRRPAPRDPAL